MDGNNLIADHIIANWGKTLEGRELTKEQVQSVRNFFESLKRLIARRVEIHNAAIQFHQASYLNKTTMEIQEDFYSRVESYFQSYYSTLSQLANVVHRFPVFNGMATSSNSKFITSLSGRYPEIGETIDVLESARAHRAFLDHPVSNRVSDWMTVTVGDERILNVIHFGDASKKGAIPQGAINKGVGILKSDWRKPTPNYFEVEECLSIVISKVIEEISGGLRVITRKPNK